MQQQRTTRRQRGGKEASSLFGNARRRPIVRRVDNFKTKPRRPAGHCAKITGKQRKRGNADWETGRKRETTGSFVCSLPGKRHASGLGPKLLSRVYEIPSWPRSTNRPCRRQRSPESLSGRQKKPVDTPLSNATPCDSFPAKIRHFRSPSRYAARILPFSSCNASSGNGKKRRVNRRDSHRSRTRSSNSQSTRRNCGFVLCEMNILWTHFNASPVARRMLAESESTHFRARSRVLRREIEISLGRLSYRKETGAARIPWRGRRFSSAGFSKCALSIGGNVLQRNSANHSGAYSDACHNERLATFCFGPVGRKYRPFWIFNFQRSSKPLRLSRPPPPPPLWPLVPL